MDEALPARVDQGDAGELVAIARITRTRGLRGELVAELLTDFPERFAGLQRVTALMPDGRRRALVLERHWFQPGHAGQVVLKFAGFETVEAAQALAGCDIAVPESECVALEDGAFYDWQLAGCAVEGVDGTQIGRVREVMHTGGTPILVVDGAAGREHLLPLAEDICVEIDIQRRRVRVDPPAGLLEL